MRNCTLIVLFLTLTLCTTSHAQQKKTTYTVGAELSDMTYVNGAGIGAFIKREQSFKNPVLSWTVSGGISYYGGSYHYYNYKLYDSVKDRGAVFAPVLAGVRFNPVNYFYLSAEAGFLVAVSKTASTCLLLVPSAGVKIPIKDRFIDLNFRYSDVGNLWSDQHKTWMQSETFGIWSVSVGCNIF